jgi:hypothetical protein
MANITIIQCCKECGKEILNPLYRVGVFVFCTKEHKDKYLNKKEVAKNAK